MAKKHAKSKAKPSSAQRRSSPKFIFMNAPNPKRKTGKRKKGHGHRPKHRGNPSVSVKRAGMGLAKSAGNAVRFGIIGIVSGVAVREASQFVLKENNSGWKGYLANLAFSVIGSIAARYVGGTKSDQVAVLTGGAMATALRGYGEIANPFTSLNGLGDPQTLVAGRALRVRLAGARPRGIASADQPGAVVPMPPPPSALRPLRTVNGAR